MKYYKFFAAILLGWTAIHIILLQIVGPGCGFANAKNNFWPFDEGVLRCIYDISEFSTYVYPVWVIFISYIIIDIIFKRFQQKK